MGAAGTGTSLVLVVEIPPDTLGEEVRDDVAMTRRGQMAGLVRRSVSAIGRGLATVNPLGPSRVAAVKVGEAAQVVVIKLNLRKLARAGRAFRKLDGAGLVRFAGGVGKGARSAAGKVKSPRVARHVHRVATSVRDIARNVDPGAAAVLARRAAESAKSVVTRLDPRDVTEAVRRVADTAESGVGGKGEKRLGGGRRVERFARSGLARIGPERAAQVADEAVRVLKELVVKLDPDQVARLAGEIFAAAKSANSRKTRFRVFGLLASIVKETSRAFKSVAGNLSMRDVAVVALVVLTTAPELLVALGVGAGVIRVMVSLAGVLVELFSDKKGVGGIGAEGRPTGLPEPEGEFG